MALKRNKLTERDVLTMRRMYEEDGLCIKCIAKLHDLPYATANHAIKRRTWKTLKAPAP